MYSTKSASAWVRRTDFTKFLTRVVEFASALVKCDSCLIYILEGDELVLRASKNPHPDVVDRLKLRVGQGITGMGRRTSRAGSDSGRRLRTIRAFSFSTSCRKTATKRFCRCR